MLSGTDMALTGNCLGVDMVHDGGENLRELAALSCKRNLRIGVACMPWPLLNDPAYAATVARHFNGVTVEHHMKWGPLLDEDGYAESDKAVRWATSRGMTVRGHTLVWAVTSPAWLLDLPCIEFRQAVKAHIYSCVAHFTALGVTEWDVVNEALAPDGSLANNMFARKWREWQHQQHVQQQTQTQTQHAQADGAHGCSVGGGGDVTSATLLDFEVELGEDGQPYRFQYLLDCFKWARDAAGPKATLLYNENKVEGCGLPHPHSRKSDAMYSMLQSLLARGAPIDGCGLQAHFSIGRGGLNRCPPPWAVARNIRRLGNLGLQVDFSEFDLRTCYMSDACGEAAGDAARSRAGVQLVRDVLAAALSEKAFVGVTFWGVDDDHSWVHQFYENDTPLLFRCATDTADTENGKDAQGAPEQEGVALVGKFAEKGSWYQGGVGQTRVANPIFFSVCDAVRTTCPGGCYCGSNLSREGFAEAEAGNQAGDQADGEDGFGEWGEGWLTKGGVEAAAGEEQGGGGGDSDNRVDGGDGSDQTNAKPDWEQT